MRIFHLCPNIPPGWIMALNIKDKETERLAAEVAALAGETKTQAVRTALSERRQRLVVRVVRRDRSADILRFLRSEVWPSIPKSLLGKRVTRAERERTLGYGREGV